MPEELMLASIAIGIKWGGTGRGKEYVNKGTFIQIIMGSISEHLPSRFIRGNVDSSIKDSRLFPEVEDH